MPQMKKSLAFSCDRILQPYHLPKPFEKQKMTGAALKLRQPYSASGYEPRILTKLQCLANRWIAPATLRSCAWPSQSMKKKYSHAFRLLGRDSIFVILIL